MPISTLLTASQERRTAAIIIAALAFGGIMATQTAHASTGVRPCDLDEHCYLLVELGVRDIDTHIDNAEEIGGHLATISDAAENAAVVSVLTEVRS